MKRHSAVIIGIGDYARKLLTPLHQYFDILALIDVSDEPSTHLPRWARRCFRTIPDSLDDLSSQTASDVVFLFTPNHTHARLAIPFLAKGRPIVVEKPLATSHEDLDAFRHFAKLGAPLYCSDFYADVRAAALLLAVGRISEDSWLARKISPRRGLFNSVGSLEHISALESRLHEKHPVRRGTWLDEKKAGGVILDMLPHSLALLRRLLPHEDLHIEGCHRKYRHCGEPVGVFVSEPPQANAAESFVRIEARTSSGVPVTLEASKENPSQDRFFEIRMGNDRLRQEFGPREPLTVVRGGKPAVFQTDGDRYWLMARAVSEWLDRGPTTYGWEWTEWAVNKLLEIRGRPTPAKREEEPLSLSSILPRRKVVKWGGLALVSGVVVEVLNIAADLLTVEHEIAVRVSEPARRAAEETEKYLTAERQLVLSNLIAPSRSLAFRTGNEHKDAPIGGAPFPHDLKAISPFMFLAAGGVEVVKGSGFPLDLKGVELLVCTGSPTSSSLARALMASPGGIRNLPYSFRELEEDPFVRVFSGMLGGVVLKKGKQVLNSEGQPLFDDHDNINPDDGLIKRDYLVISRLPGARPDQDVLLLSGGHGAGTQAAELLFRPSVFCAEDMQFLITRIGGERYWQAVFEVTEMRNRAPMTEGLNLTLVREVAPPVAFSPVFDGLGVSRVREPRDLV